MRTLLLPSSPLATATEQVRVGALAPGCQRPRSHGGTAAHRGSAVRRDCMLLGEHGPRPGWSDVAPWPRRASTPTRFNGFRVSSLNSFGGASEQESAPARSMHLTSSPPCPAERNTVEQRIRHAAWMIRSTVQDSMIIQRNADWYEVIPSPSKAQRGDSSPESL